MRTGSAGAQPSRSPSPARWLSVRNPSQIHLPSLDQAADQENRRCCHDSVQDLCIKKVYFNPCRPPHRDWGAGSKPQAATTRLGSMYLVFSRHMNLICAVLTPGSCPPEQLLPRGVPAEAPAAWRGQQQYSCVPQLCAVRCSAQREHTSD